MLVGAADPGPDVHALRTESATTDAAARSRRVRDVLMPDSVRDPQIVSTRVERTGIPATMAACLSAVCFFLAAATSPKARAFLVAALVLARSHF